MNTKTLLIKKKWPVAVIFGGLMAVANGAASQGSITVSVIANGHLDPTVYTYTGSGSYDSFGAGSYNGVSWNNLAVGQVASGSVDELSVGAVGVTNSASANGTISFAAVDNNFVLPTGSLAAAMQTAFNGNLNAGVTGDGVGFTGGASEASGSVPVVSQSQGTIFTNPQYSQAFSTTETLQNIRSADITGAMSLYADAGSNFNSPGYLGNMSTVANVFPGPITTPEPATLGLMALAGVGVCVLHRRLSRRVCIANGKLYWIRGAINRVAAGIAADDESGRCLLVLSECLQMRRLA